MHSGKKKGTILYGGGGICSREASPEESYIYEGYIKLRQGSFKIVPNFFLFEKNSFVRVHGFNNWENVNFPFVALLQPPNPLNKGGIKTDSLPDGGAKLIPPYQGGRKGGVATLARQKSLFSIGNVL